MLDDVVYAAAIQSTPCSSTGTNLVTNPSFESPSVAPNVFERTQPTGWTGEVVLSRSAVYANTDGDQTATVENRSLQQAIPTGSLAGATLRLTLRHGGRLTAGYRRHRVRVDTADGAALAWLHAHGDVIAEDADAVDTWVEVRLAPEDHERFVRRA